MNIKEVLSAPRAPWQRANVERVIGSIRRECLDHVIVVNEDGLRRVLASYIRDYHQSRLHLSLDKDSPDPRPVQTDGTIIAILEVGGLHHRYERRVLEDDLSLESGEGSSCVPIVHLKLIQDAGLRMHGSKIGG
jgi:hypothetical protein